MTVPGRRQAPLPLPRPVEGVYYWRVEGRRRPVTIMIRVKWRAKRQNSRAWTWVPVTATIDGGVNNELPVALMRTVPWSLVMAETHPLNEDRLTEPLVVESPPVDPVPVTPPRPMPYVSLEALSAELGTKAYNALRRHGIDTIEAAMMLDRLTLLEIDGFGEMTVAHIEEVLAKYRVEVPE